MCGLHNELIQKRLLSEPSLSLAKTREITIALEAAAKDTQVERHASRNLTVIDVVPVNTHQPSVILGTNPA